MRIGGRFRGGGSNLQKRHEGQGGHRRTATSDRLGAVPAQPMDAELGSMKLLGRLRESWWLRHQIV
jgi:hypothetical protein